MKNLMQKIERQLDGTRKKENRKEETIKKNWQSWEM